MIFYKKIIAVFCLVFLVSTSSHGQLGGNVVTDPGNTSQNLANGLRDSALWARDFILSEFRNQAQSATNSIELTRLLDALANGEVSESTIGAIQGIAGAFTLGIPGLSKDIGDITINQDVLIEVMSERLAQEMRYQRAHSSRSDSIEGAILEQLPDLGILQTPEFQTAFNRNNAGARDALESSALRTEYDTGVAALRSNKALAEGLADADAVLSEVRSDVLNENLGTNALLRRVMKVSLIEAEHSRAVAEAVITQTDLIAQQAAIGASRKAAAKAEAQASNESDRESRAEDDANSVEDDPDVYWGSREL